MIGLWSRFLMGFRVPLPEPCRDCGKRKRKFGRPQPDRALRRVQRPSRSSARRARHARREEAAARGSARLRASLDRRCTRRSVTVQAGTEKRHSNRTEKHDGRRRGSRDEGMVTSVDTKHKAGTTDISGFLRTINYRGLDIVLRQYLRQLLRSIILSARNRLYDPQTLRYLRK